MKNFSILLCLLLSGLTASAIWPFRVSNNPGTNGQVVTMGSDGIPRWSNAVATSSSGSGQPPSANLTNWSNIATSAVVYPPALNNASNSLVSQIASGQVWTNRIDTSFHGPDLVIYPAVPTNLTLIQRGLTIGTNASTYWGSLSGQDGESIVSIHDENDTSNGELFNELVFGFHWSTNSEFHYMQYDAGPSANIFRLKSQDPDGNQTARIELTTYNDGSGGITLYSSNNITIDLESRNHGNDNRSGQIEMRDQDGVSTTTLEFQSGSPIFAGDTNLTILGRIKSKGATNSTTLDVAGAITTYTSGGIASLATNATVAIVSTGITNTLASNYRLFGLTGTSIVQTNRLVGFSRGTITVPTDIVLQPGEFVKGSSIAVQGSQAF